MANRRASVHLPSGMKGSGCAARRLPEPLDGSGNGQGLDLCPHGLPVGGYPRVPVNHAITMQRISAAEKYNPLNALNSAAKFLINAADVACDLW